MTDVTDVLYVGDRAIRTETIPTLLKQYELLPKFLEELAIDEAIEEYGCTAEEKQKALLEICQRHQLTNLEEQQKWMDERGLQSQEVEVMATRPIRLQKFKEEKWGRKVRRYFMERKPGLDLVIYSLIRTQDPGLAHELYYRILEGEITFEQCAASYSQGPEARTGGRLGPVPLNRPHPVISKLLSVSQPGQLWPPRPLSDWHIIIRLEDIKSAQLDDQTRQALIDELYNAWLQERVQALTAQVFSPEQQAKGAAIAAAPTALTSDVGSVNPSPSTNPDPHHAQEGESVTEHGDTPGSDSQGMNQEGDSPEIVNDRNSVQSSSEHPETNGTEPDMVITDAPEVENSTISPWDGETDQTNAIDPEVIDPEPINPQSTTSSSTPSSTPSSASNAALHTSLPNAPQSLVSTSA